ncbi:MAG: hypothetical protein MK116_14445, partial [Phycisphaerales bacterium]|nr:hypothetical protein [Phycisphaerales bacterium]
ISAERYAKESFESYSPGVYDHVRARTVSILVDALSRQGKWAEADHWIKIGLELDPESQHLLGQQAWHAERGLA